MDDTNIAVPLQIFYCSFISFLKSSCACAVEVINAPRFVKGLAD